jgi:hypothetical protein
MRERDVGVELLDALRCCCGLACLPLTDRSGRTGTAKNKERCSSDHNNPHPHTTCLIIVMPVYTAAALL